jgi:plastocyanin
MSKQSRRRAQLGAAALLLTLLGAGCGSSSPSESAGTTTASTAPSDDSTVTIDDFAFGPGSMSVAAGTTVTWTNEDSAPHTVTADDDSWTSETLATGDSFTHTFDAAGTVAYHCALHPRMTASVVVEA